ncbi:MAG: hypothetical protein IRZ15_05340, partial [Bryobacteraceae bacterium]|nr:hypothetical protein [Bryobacteraceae bacterium]
AALENQQLFDALAEEEALREVLADPAVRRQLLNALSEDGQKPFLIPWLRPRFVLAASLIVTALTTFVVLDRVRNSPQETQVADVRMAAPKTEPPVESSDSGKERQQKTTAAAKPPGTLPLRAGRRPEGATPLMDTAAAPEAAALSAPAEAFRAQPRQVQPQQMTVRYTLAVVRRDGRLEPLKDQSKPAGALHLTVEVNPPGYIYVLSTGSNGTFLVTPVSSLVGPGGTRQASYSLQEGSAGSIHVYFSCTAESDPHTLLSRHPEPSGRPAAIGQAWQLSAPADTQLLHIAIPLR